MAAHFGCVDAAVIRVAVFGSGLELPPWPDLTGDTPEHVREWRNWLRRVWEQDAIIEAIEVASPVLARRVENVCGGQVEQPRRVRRVVESVIRYLLRMTSRATPFGLFAGVAPLRIGSAASVRWGERHRAVARPDAGWLAEVITQLEARPEVLRRLPVVANNLGFVRGDRLVVPCQQHPGAVRPGDVSVRHTRAVQAVIQAAQSPITIGELIGKLAAELPGKPLVRIEAMLTELVCCRILVTSLHAPMDVTDPLGYVIDQLTAVETGAAPLSMARELRTISGQLSQHDQASSPGVRRALRASVSQRMSAICDRPGPSLAVDLRVGCSVVLPQAVAREAEAAASALVRLTPHRFGNPAWAAWHARFLERYGSGAVVPVGQIVDADTGLGYPAGFRGSVMKQSDPPLLARDRTLLRLAQQAALDGCEVVLDEHALSELASESTETRPPDGPPHIELRFSVQALTTNALDRGEFTLVVVSAARQAGTTTGRFLHLVDSGDRGRMVQAFTGLATLTPGALLAQVSCPPLSARTVNLARTPAIFPTVALGEHRPEGIAQVPLDDLAVSGDAHRLFLVSLSRGHVVEPMMMNAVEFRRATHPLARFLCEITTAREAACVPFAWGAASGLPFLPRVRHGRTMLRPASWNLSASDLPGRRATWREWSQTWDGLRRRYRIPDVVHLGEQDVRIRVDLNEPAHLAMLRTHVTRAGNAMVTEAPDAHDHGWNGGHAHEVVIPLTATRPRSAPPSARRAGPIRAIHHPGHTPGNSPWLYARLYGHPDRQADLLTTHLPDLLSAWEDGPADDWWFLRYREPEPHLRLRIRLHDARAYGAAAQRLGAWADRVRRFGLLRNIVLDTYYPEVGRYGTGTALHAAEAVFAADSAVAIAALTVTASGTPHPYAVIAASFTDLAAAFTGSLSSGLNWLIDHVNHYPVPALAREIHDQAMRLTDPSGDWAALRALPGGALLALAWGRRRSALAAYRTHLHPMEGPDPDPVLASLLHLHHARTAGINQDSERICRRLARAAALGWVARHERSTPSRSTSAMPTPPLS